MTLYKDGKIIKTRQSREFWTVKQHQGLGYLNVGRVHLPREMIGRRVIIQVIDAIPKKRKSKALYEIIEPEPADE